MCAFYPVHCFFNFLMKLTKKRCLYSRRTEDIFCFSPTLLRYSSAIVYSFACSSCLFVFCCCFFSLKTSQTRWPIFSLSCDTYRSSWLDTNLVILIKSYVFSYSPVSQNYIRFKLYDLHWFNEHIIIKTRWQVPLLQKSKLGKHRYIFSFVLFRFRKRQRQTTYFLLLLLFPHLPFFPTLLVVSAKQNTRRKKTSLRTGTEICL